jgi:hypothetical protein
MIYYFAQTTTTPEVSFHFSSNKLSIKGEVYPEMPIFSFNLF